MSKRLRIGNLKGAPGSEIKLNIKPSNSALGHFTTRVYPRRLNPAIPHSPTTATGVKEYRVSDERPTLSEYVTLTHVVGIAATSKSSVIRRRLVRRLQSAWRSELSKQEKLPKVPIHIIISPQMSILRARMEDLCRDVELTWTSILQKAPRRIKNPKDVHTEAPLSRGEKKVPMSLRTRASIASNMDNIVHQLPKSSYLDSHGGAEDLLARMRQK